jgi:hypothetical protein
MGVEGSGEAVHEIKDGIISVHAAIVSSRRREPYTRAHHEALPAVLAASRLPARLASRAAVGRADALTSRCPARLATRCRSDRRDPQAATGPAVPIRHPQPSTARTLDNTAGPARRCGPVPAPSPATPVVSRCRNWGGAPGFPEAQIEHLDELIVPLVTARASGLPKLMLAVPPSWFCA